MLSRRTLLYLTIPSLTLLIGLWFRRKKALSSPRSPCGSKEATDNQPVDVSLSEHQTSASSDRICARRDISESVPISSGSEDDISLLHTSGCSSTNSNKSIGQLVNGSGPNSRSPPIPIANKPGSGGHTSDELNSVDDSDVESADSPDDLHGSYERRNFEMVKNSHLFNKRANRSADVPIKVITASKSPKISPKNAFSEATTSTPASKKQSQKQQQQQQSPKSEDQLVIQSPMAKLSLLDDSKTSNKNNSVVETNSATETKAAAAVNSNNNNNNNNIANSNTTSTQEEAPKQPPSANSPSLSLYSVHSNDSGKGSSPVQSEAATAAGADQSSSQSICYEFLVHEKYVGLLIGRGGLTVKRLMKRFGVHMIVRRVPNCPRPTDRVCAILGAPAQVDGAIQMLRQKLPLEMCPDLSMERVYYASSPVPALGNSESKATYSSTTTSSNSNAAEANTGSNKYSTKKPVMPIHYPVAQLPLSLSLVEGINNDVVISAILNGGHVFVQQQSHPTFQQLQALHTVMSQHYEAGDSPALETVDVGSICVTPLNGVWYRMVIVSGDDTGDEPQCVVKFLDFGGFVTVPLASLRQIRTDFMALPFQSIECVLSNLRPVGGGEWPKEAAELVLQFSTGRVLQAQVAGYTEDGLPEVLLYAALGPDNIAFVNQELVAQGYAEWMECAEEEAQEEVLAQ